MLIQVNTDKNIEGSEGLNAYLDRTLTTALDRFKSQITRIEVHLADQNSHKEGHDDIRCSLEARLEGLQPIVVSNNGDSVDFALKGAIDKMKASLDTVLGRLNNHR